MATATDEDEETATLVPRSTVGSEATSDPIHPKLPVWRKVAYGSGSMVYSMTTVVLGFFLQIFLLEVAILDPVYVAVIVFSGRVWDAVTDPMIGYLSSRTRTRIGRLRPWLLFSVLPIGVSYFFIWFVPRWPQGAKFAYYLLVYFTLQALMTCFHVPYTALIMHLTDCNKQRDSATLYRMCFEVAGTMLGSLVQGMAIALSRGNSNTACVQGGARTYDDTMEGAYRYGALTVAVVAVLAGLVPFFGVKEQREQQNVRKGLPFFKGLRVTLLYRPYTYLTALYMLCWLAVQFVQANLALYVKYVTGLGDHFQYIIIVLLLCSILSMPFWQYLIVKFGKKTTFYCGIWVFMLTLLVLLFLDKWDFVVYIAYPVAAVAGVGVGAVYLLPWSMLPDVVDQANLDHGVRREELFYSFYVFFSKFGAGVSLGISTLVLKLGEYNEEVCLQLWTVSLTLKLMLSVAPVLLVLVSLIFLWLYPITEAVRRRNRLQLAKRRHQSGPPEQIVYSTSNQGNEQQTLATADGGDSTELTASQSLTPPTPRGSSLDDKAFRTTDSGDMSNSTEVTNV